MEKIEIRCRQPRCNRLLMNYYVKGKDVELCLEGFELKCDKCKRVLRLKNYTENTLRMQARDGVFRV